MKSSNIIDNSGNANSSEQGSPAIMLLLTQCQCHGVLLSFNEILCNTDRYLSITNTNAKGNGAVKSSKGNAMNNDRTDGTEDSNEDRDNDDDEDENDGEIREDIESSLIEIIPVANSITSIITSMLGSTHLLGGNCSI